LELWRVFRPVVADSHQFGEEQDPDPTPHQGEKSNPDPQKSDKEPQPCFFDKILSTPQKAQIFFKPISLKLIRAMCTFPIILVNQSFNINI
jgi:hypothetical protein